LLSLLSDAFGGHFDAEYLADVTVFVWDAREIIGVAEHAQPRVFVVVEGSLAQQKRSSMSSQFVHQLSYTNNSSVVSGIREVERTDNMTDYEIARLMCEHPTLTLAEIMTMISAMKRRR
jgi:hypothetical protein